MRGQKGVTLSGFLVWAVLVVIVLLLGFKLAPPYMEYAGVQKLIKNLASDPGMAAGDYKKNIAGNFGLRAGIDNIQSIGPGDLVIKKEGNNIVVTADYTVRVPLIGNISACLDFNASSEK